MKVSPQHGPHAGGDERGQMDLPPAENYDMAQIDQAIRDVLSTVGLSEAPPIVIETVSARGGTLTSDGRLLFPEKLFDEALAGFTRNFTLYGQSPCGHRRCCASSG